MICITALECEFHICYGSVNLLLYLSFIYLQGLKVLDSSVETFASGAWQAFGNAWKGGSSLVQKYVCLVSA